MRIVSSEYSAATIAVCLVLALAANMSDRACAQMTLRADHAGAGLHAMSGDTYTLRGTAGQAAVLRRTSSPGVSSGFWFASVGLVNVSIENPEGASSSLQKSVRVSALYPNPAMDRTTFSITVPSSGLRIDASVYDVTGRRVKSVLQSGTPIGSQQYDIDLGQLSAGIYFLRVSVDDAIVSRRFVVLGE